MFLLPQAVDRNALARPDDDAVRFAGRSLSWSALATRSDRLANALGAAGVRRGDRVGIYMNKALETPIALYGIMKAGAAYVPLDPSAPGARTAAILRECGIDHVITANDKLATFEALAADGQAPRVLIGPDRDPGFAADCLSWSDVNSLPATPPTVRIIESDLAYIIFTSGSTGRPKGIMHTHHSGLSFARWAASEYGLAPSDRLSNHAPLHFDLSILDYFAGAVAGSTTVIIGEEYLRLPASYSSLIADERLTVLYTVPFALIQLLLHGVLDQRDLSALRWVIFGGEPMSVRQLRALMDALPGARFDNIYGPAEVNGVTHYTVDSLPADARSIPIGPMANTAQGLVVNAEDRPVPPGVEGELLVRTPTMMPGYWQRDDLNASVFFRRAGPGGIDEVFFRTGDLVRMDDDGIFEFVGRKDRQVKVRGYRVELDEVEGALSASPGVEEVAAFSVDAGVGTVAIHAAVTAEEGATLDVATLSGGLAATLPWYAMPAKLSIRSRFPRTSTGKIDRRRLALDAAAELRRAAGQTGAIQT